MTFLCVLGTATAIGQVIDVPILTRSLADSIVLVPPNKFPVPFDSSIFNILDNGLPEGDACSLAESYTFDWWNEKKEPGADKMIDMEGLLEALDHHATVKKFNFGNPIAATPPRVNEPEPAGENSCLDCQVYRRLLTKALNKMKEVYRMANMAEMVTTESLELAKRKGSIFHMLYERSLEKEMEAAVEPPAASTSSEVAPPAVSRSSEVNTPAASTTSAKEQKEVDTPAASTTSGTGQKEIDPTPPPATDPASKWTWGVNLTDDDVLQLCNENRRRNPGAEHTGYARPLSTGSPDPAREDSPRTYLEKLPEGATGGAPGSEATPTEPAEPETAQSAGAEDAPPDLPDDVEPYAKGVLYKKGPLTLQDFPYRIIQAPAIHPPPTPPMVEHRFATSSVPNSARSGGSEDSVSVADGPSGETKRFGEIEGEGESEEQHTRGDYAMDVDLLASSDEEGPGRQVDGVNSASQVRPPVGIDNDLLDSSDEDEPRVTSTRDESAPPVAPPTWNPQDDLNILDSSDESMSPPPPAHAGPSQHSNDLPIASESAPPFPNMRLPFQRSHISTDELFLGGFYIPKDTMTPAVANTSAPKATHQIDPPPVVPNVEAPPASPAGNLTDRFHELLQSDHEDSPAASPLHPTVVGLPSLRPLLDAVLAQNIETFLASDDEGESDPAPPAAQNDVRMSSPPVATLPAEGYEGSDGEVDQLEDDGVDADDDGEDDEATDEIPIMRLSELDLPHDLTAVDFSFIDHTYLQGDEQGPAEEEGQEDASEGSQYADGEGFDLDVDGEGSDYDNEYEQSEGDRADVSA
ncbi:hypothetical protein CVT26_012135 [Gymnopilus dilepis]|uniref:Uncharacterized protein n=1 Tax=Gymnopilus dilepis TaxID=231916 RepID=A0A409X495_9AGAR|nr:hypothetical protein CVT26_012135 [Gymnopilus dilepis]